MMCGKCSSTTGWLLIIFGVLFLLVDLEVWDFWGISWFTMLFVVAGIAIVACKNCPDCCDVKKKK